MYIAEYYDQNHCDIWSPSTLKWIWTYVHPVKGPSSLPGGTPSVHRRQRVLFRGSSQQPRRLALPRDGGRPPGVPAATQEAPGHRHRWEKTNRRTMGKMVIFDWGVWENHRRNMGKWSFIDFKYFKWMGFKGGKILVVGCNPSYRWIQPTYPINWLKGKSWNHGFSH